MIEYWPVIAWIVGSAVASFAFAIRVGSTIQSLRDKCADIERRGDDKYMQTMSLLQEHYATKNEVSMLKGAIDTLQVQVGDMKLSIVRMENKMDSFLVAALQHQAAPRKD